MECLEPCSSGAVLASLATVKSVAALTPASFSPTGMSTLAQLWITALLALCVSLLEVA